MPKLDDLDYPQKLQTAAAEAEEAAAAGVGEVPKPEARATAEDGGAGAGGAEDSDATSAALYRTWYPPVQRTLLLLSKLYRAVDAKIFSGLAQVGDFLRE